MRKIYLILAVILGLTTIIKGQTSILDGNNNRGREDCEARFNSISGKVEVRREADTDGWKTAQPDMALSVNDHIRTGNDGSAILSFANTATCAAKANTELTLYSAGKIKLVSGKIMLGVKLLDENDTPEIDADQFILKFKGATVSIDSRVGEATLKVIDGTVDFTFKASGSTVQLSGGQMVRTDMQAMSSPQMVDLGLDRLEWTHYKTVALKNPVNLPQKKGDLVPKKEDTGLAQAETGNVKENTATTIPVLWYGIAGLVLVVLLVLVLVIGKRKNSSPISTPPARVSAVPPVKVCRKCGSPIEGQTKFCSKCGEMVDQVSQAPKPQPPPTPVCISCGAVISPGVKFCMACGTPISSTAPPATSVQAPSNTINQPPTNQPPPAKRGGSLLTIVLSLLTITCLAVAGLYFFGTFDPFSTASRTGLFEEVKGNPAKIDAAATAVETLFASADTAGLANILSPTTLEQRRPFFQQLLPYMPAFANDFKSRKLLYTTAHFAVYEFSSAKGKFTADFCLGTDGKWQLMRF